MPREGEPLHNQQEESSDKVDKPEVKPPQDFGIEAEKAQEDEKSAAFELAEKIAENADTLRIGHNPELWQEKIKNLELLHMAISPEHEDLRSALNELIEIATDLKENQGEGYEKFEADDPEDLLDVFMAGAESLKDEVAGQENNPGNYRQ